MPREAGREDDDPDPQEAPAGERETSPSGAPILRHGPGRRAFEPAAADQDLRARIAAHVAEHLGPVELVLEEPVSHLVPIDILVVPPRPGREWYTLVTAGMSARPMRAPRELPECRFAELSLCLPPEWGLSQDTEFAPEERYWPLRWLRRLARFPHEHDTWLFWGHSVPNGEPPRPFAPGTRLCCMVLLEPARAPAGFGRLTLAPGRTLRIFGLVPLHADELAFKLREGGAALEARLRAAGVDELLRAERPSACG